MIRNGSCLTGHSGGQQQVGTLFLSRNLMPLLYTFCNHRTPTVGEAWRIDRLLRLIRHRLAAM
jgi:hypothetical protein